MRDEIGAIKIAKMEHDLKSRQEQGEQGEMLERSVGIDSPNRALILTH